MIKNQVIDNWEAIFQHIEHNKIKHFSFDFWNTIAYPNFEFKKKRAEIILCLIKKNTDYLVVNEAFAKVGKEYNNDQESGLKILSSIDLLGKVMKELNHSFSYSDLYKLKLAIDDIFLKYPPKIDNNLHSLIHTIKYYGKTCSITSNTAFISGDVIKKFLSDVKFLNNFSFCLFSNELGFGKPSKKMFELLFLKARALQSQLKKSEIAHIGDNEITDYEGAWKFGLKSFQINVKPNFTSKKYAVHYILETKSILFNAIEYSKFKFGEINIANRYGNELFKYFKNTILPDLLHNYDSILIYSSPYDQIPTSSYYLTQSFFSAFSDYLRESKTNNVIIKFCKIKRCQTYTEDYGSLNAEERFNLIKNDTYEFVDIPSAKDICIFIDDISITGTHQRVVEKLIQDSEIKTNSIFLYYAKLSNPDVCPSFENYLNYSFTSDVVKLMEVVLSDFYKITTRTTKYILSLNTKDLEYLINQIKQRDKYSILHELVKMSEANQYNNIELYKQNLTTLKQCLLELNTESINTK